MGNSYYSGPDGGCILCHRHVPQENHICKRCQEQRVIDDVVIHEFAIEKIKYMIGKIFSILALSMLLTFSSDTSPTTFIQGNIGTTEYSCAIENHNSVCNVVFNHELKGLYNYKDNLFLEQAIAYVVVAMIAGTTLNKNRIPVFNFVFPYGESNYVLSFDDLAKCTIIFDSSNESMMCSIDHIKVAKKI